MRSKRSPVHCLACCFALFPALVIMVLLTTGCRKGAATPKHIKVDGIDVILNKRDPLSSRGKTIALKGLFRLDTGDAALEAKGLFDIFKFDVDPRGDIFVINSVTAGIDYVFHFGRDGKFIGSFGKRGQGPGEFQNPLHIAEDKDGNLLVFDQVGQRLMKFGPQGNFLNERPLKRIMQFSAGPDDTLVACEDETHFDMDNAVVIKTINILGPDLKVKAELDKLSVTMNGLDMTVAYPVVCWAASGKEIFVADQAKGYEISVFGPTGKLLRKIRKESEPAPFTEAEKEKNLKQMPKAWRTKVNFPKFHPAIRGLFASEDVMLLVETFEPGTQPGEHAIDVFDPEGVFVQRLSLAPFNWENYSWARFRGDRFYCLSETADGGKALTVYQVERR